MNQTEHKEMKNISTDIKYLVEELNSTLDKVKQMRNQKSLRKLSKIQDLKEKEMTANIT